jgi:hypothetical protein
MIKHQQKHQKNIQKSSKNTPKSSKKPKKTPKNAPSTPHFIQKQPWDFNAVSTPNPPRVNARNPTVPDQKTQKNHQKNIKKHIKSTPNTSLIKQNKNKT